MVQIQENNMKVTNIVRLSLVYGLLEGLVSHTVIFISTPKTCFNCRKLTCVLSNHHFKV